MTTTDAMKQFLCYVKNDGSTIADITQTNVADLWEQIGIAFNARFNNGSESGGTSGTLGTLTISSAPGSTFGATILEVSNASGSESNFKYKIEGSVLNYGENLSSWESWTGQEITVEDGAHICVAEIDGNSCAIAVGFVTADVKLI